MTLPDRVSDLYHRALECAPDKRIAFLDQACAGDAALRAQASRCSATMRPRSSRVRLPSRVPVGQLERAW
jgi:hypothetical protein